MHAELLERARAVARAGLGADAPAIADLARALGSRRIPRAPRAALYAALTLLDGEPCGGVVAAREAMGAVGAATDLWVTRLRKLRDDSVLLEQVDDDAPSPLESGAACRPPSFSRSSPPPLEAAGHAGPHRHVEAAGTCKMATFDLGELGLVRADCSQLAARHGMPIGSVVHLPNHLWSGWDTGTSACRIEGFVESLPCAPVSDGSGSPRKPAYDTLACVLVR